MDVHDYMDQINKERIEKGQKTLGDLIEALYKAKTGYILLLDGKEVKLKDYGSYRGDYSHLYLEFEEAATKSVADFVAALEYDILGSLFTGWKGGEFRMIETTPIWIAELGCTSETVIVDVKIDHKNKTADLITAQMEY